MPCLPRKDPNIIEPKETQQWKHVDRYGETKIRYASRGLKVRPRSAHQLQPGRNYTQKASKNDPVQEHEPPKSSKLPPPKPRPVSASKENDYVIVEEPRVQDVTTLPPSRQLVHQQIPPPEIYDVDDSYVIEQAQKRETVQHYAKREPEDFYVSVPIFTEKLNHSMRHKNAYVYEDSQVISDSMSYASSMQEYSMAHQFQRPSDKLKPQPHPQSAQPALLQRPSTGTMKTYSHYSAPFQNSLSRHNPASEISFRTNQSSSGSVYDVEFDPPCTLRKTRRLRGIIIDSDNEDYR
ncbi:hypothetical protein CHS0354_013956 [Potamilus streckersoni]|uniref:Uncharacterized protein n=1 Tax=Potamilus streckersoni TaxID=2493646 RepID=A0AAE0RWN5_9BIVA|nr:hypothetical protein CHS0354_013956 [Potamilus streckersoni]